jgi:CHAT domain-containing protein
MRLVAGVRCGEMRLSHPALIALAAERARGVDDSGIHAGALIDLALQSDDWQGYTAIIDRLRQAAALGEAGAATSLATAHVVRGSTVDDPTDVLRALDLVLRSTDATPDDPVVRFNTAVLLERMHLTAEALGAWNDYLSIDSESDWADEARARIRQLDAARGTGPTNASTARPLPFDAQRSREFAIDQLLPEWARSHLAGETGPAATALDSARAIGETLNRTNGDHVVADAVAAVDRAVQERRATNVAAGLAAWGVGRTHYESARYDDAAQPLAEASGILRSEPIALRGWPQLYLAGVHIIARQLGEAGLSYDRVRLNASRDTHPSLWARAAWGAGLVSLLQQDLPLAIARYDSAAAVFDRIGERENIGGVQFLLMETYAGLGQRRESLEHAVQALDILEDRPGSQMRHNTLASLGLELRAAGFAHAAVAVLSEGADAAERSGQPKNLVEALSRLAVAEMDVDRMALARTHVDRALDEYARVSDRFMTVWSEAELARAHARLLRDEDPASARLALTTAVDFYRITNNPVLLFPALAERAALSMANGNTAAALTDLEEAVSDLGRRTSMASADPATVATLLESASPVFDGLIAIGAQQGDTEAAYHYAETARAVALAASSTVSPDVARDLLRARDGSALLRTRRALEPGQMLVHSAVLTDRMYFWYVTADTMILRTVEVNETEVLDAIQRFTVLLESSATANADSIGRRLHDMVLGSITSETRVDELIIVPDKALQRIPFAALRSPVTDNYLVEEMAVVVAPSAAFALRDNEQTAPPPFERVLLIADPDFDDERFPELPRLRSASQEIERVAEQYADEVKLEGADATIAAFRDAARSADLVHFAGHGLYRPDRPELSHLVFASTGDSDGALFARDIRRLDLLNAPLIVLSACETALPELTRTGGYGALARAFLVAGAPAVVGSMWLVDDEDTAHFMESFHRQLAAGLTPAAALQAAQVEAIRAGDRSPVWAAFRYEGIAGA